ncbi:MAG: O-antigen ligase family protein [Candidatus Omnitrophota bacterium]
MLSITQTITNIYKLGGSYVLISEIIHYALVFFILICNFRKIKYIDTGLILFIVYSFRIFDTSLFVNEFVFLHALSLILGLLWIEDIYLKKQRLPKVNLIFTPGIILVVIAIFSTITAVCPYYSLAQMMIMINFAFIAFLIANHVKGMDQIKLLIFTLFCLGFFLFVLLIKDELLWRGIYSLMGRIWIELGNPNGYRIHPNSLAGYFAALLCLLIGDRHFYRGKIFKAAKILVIIIMAVILLLTFSRLGIFSFILSVSILFWLRYKETIKIIKNRALYMFLIIGLITGVIFLSPIKQNLIRRIYDFGSNSQTLYSCRNSLKAIKDNPLLGFGLDNYYILSKYAKEQILSPNGQGMLSTRNVIWSPSHSTYLGIAFGLGIMGLLVFIWLLVSIVIYFIRLNKFISDDKSEKALLQAIFVAFISVLIHGVLAMTFHLTILPAFFWVFIGLMIAIGNVVNFNKSCYEFKPWGFYIVLLVVLLFSIGVVINPVIAEARYISAQKSFSLGELQKAMRAINQAKIFMPIDPKIYELEAEIKNAKGLVDQAIADYKRALTFKKDFAFYHTRIGQLYWQKKKYPYVLLEFEKAIELDKYGVCYQEHYSDLGSFYNELGDKTQAIAQFKKAILIDPEVVGNTDWAGADYLDDIIKQTYQDYLMLKDKEPLAAEQILYSLRRIEQGKVKKTKNKQD